MPHSWDFISQFSLKNPPTIQLGRKQSVQDSYSKKKKYLQFINKNIHDHLMESLFSDNKEYRYLKNDYPYNLEDNIQHNVLWINPAYNEKYNEEYIIHLLNSFDTEYIVFRNNPSNMSIPSIIHYHVFTKINNKL